MLKIDEGGDSHDGLGQPGDLRDPCRTPSRGGAVARRSGSARAMARSLCRRDAFGLSRPARAAADGYSRAACPRRSCATTPRPRSRASSRPGRARLRAMAGRRLPVRPLLDRRLHVCAGGLALSHLWRRAADGLAEPIARASWRCRRWRIGLRPRAPKPRPDFRKTDLGVVVRRLRGHGQLRQLAGLAIEARSAGMQRRRQAQNRRVETDQLGAGIGVRRAMRGWPD